MRVLPGIAAHSCRGRCYQECTFAAFFHQGTDGFCNSEKAKGRHAKKLVKALLKNAKRIDLENIERGKYFRIVADVLIDGKNLTHYLVKNGLGYPYDGGTKSKVNWCKDQKVLAKEFQNMFSSYGRKAASKK